MIIPLMTNRGGSAGRVDAALFTNCWRVVEGIGRSWFKKRSNFFSQKNGRGGEGRGGEGGELSFQCLRPSTALMAAGKNIKIIGSV
jgi:hypothetical protein